MIYGYSKMNSGYPYIRNRRPIQIADNTFYKEMKFILWFVIEKQGIFGNTFH